MLEMQTREVVSAAKEDPRVRKLIGILNEAFTNVTVNDILRQIDVEGIFLGVQKHLKGYKAVRLGVSRKMTMAHENPRLFVTLSTRDLGDEEDEREEGEDKTQKPRERESITEHRVIIHLKDGYMVFQKHPDENDRRRGGRISRWVEFYPMDFVEASVETLNATIPIVRKLHEPFLVKKAAPVAVQSTASAAPAKPASDTPPVASDPKGELAKLLVQKAPDADAQKPAEETAKPKSKAVKLGKAAVKAS